MKMRGWGAAVAALLVTSTLVGPASAAQRKLEPLNQYKVTGGDQSKLGELGYDASEGGGSVVATPREADALRAKGYTVTPLGKENKSAVAAPPDPFSDPTHGYNVFRPWHLKPAPCPGTCTGAVDANGQPIT